MAGTENLPNGAATTNKVIEEMKTIDIPLGQSTLINSQTVDPIPQTLSQSTSNVPETFQEYERLQAELQRVQKENAELKVRLDSMQRLEANRDIEQRK